MTIHPAFRVGHKVVYPMHGIGQIEAIQTRSLEGQQERVYCIALDDKTKGGVVVSVDTAEALGLRPVLEAADVPEVMQRLQQTATREPTRKKSVDHYAWCKERLRRGDTIGLSEVRRFLHDLDQVENVTHVHLRQLRTYVSAQLPAEIAQALGCSQTTAESMVTAALTDAPCHPANPVESNSGVSTKLSGDDIPVA